MARSSEACEIDARRRAARRGDALAERVRGKQALVTMFTDPVDETVLEAGSDLKVGRPWPSASTTSTWPRPAPGALW
jgi:hypothetical protein